MWSLLFLVKVSQYSMLNYKTSDFEITESWCSVSNDDEVLWMACRLIMLQWYICTYICTYLYSKQKKWTLTASFLITVLLFILIHQTILRTFKDNSKCIICFCFDELNYVVVSTNYVVIMISKLYDYMWKPFL